MGMAKFTTGIAARCPARIVRCLPWFLLAAVLYGEWWISSNCVNFTAPAPWQITSNIFFVLWCVVNLFSIIFGAVVFLGDNTFWNQSLPIWWGIIWHPRRNVRLYELVIWIVLAPSVASGTMAVIAIRAGSISIRRSNG